MKSNLWRHVRLCSPALALAWGSAWAQGPAGGVELQPVVVTATRAPVPLRQVLADVTVLSREDLDRSAGGLADVLRGVPGFQAVRSGGVAGTTSMFIRGGETRFAAVLIDGVRVDTQTTGGATWEALPLSQIDRIEILRGPASSVYGSDAMSGVVQIFTRKGERGLRAEVGASVGSQMSASTDASLSGTVGPVDFAVSGQAARSDGYNSKTNGFPDRDGYRTHGLNARVGWAVSDAHRLEASTLRSHVNSQYDGFASVADDHSFHDLDTTRLQWVAQWLPAWRSTVAVGESRDRYETRPSVYITETRIRNASWQNDITVGAHTFNATLEQRRDLLDNTGLVGPQVRELSNDALALGYGWRSGPVSLQANARHDEHDTFGSVDTGSVAAGLDLAAGWRLQGSWGNAFRAPTLYQSYSAYGPTNRPLRPERSLSNVELGLHHHAGPFDSSVTAYRNRIASLIVFGAPGPCPDAFGCYENVGNALLKGVTLASRYAADGLRLSGSFDWLSPKNLDTGKVLQRRARRHAAFSVEKDVGEAILGAQWLVSGHRFENAANTQRLGGYSVLNLDAQYRLNSQWRLQAKVDNVFDKKYQTANTYVSNPQTAFVGVRWAPKP